MASTKTERLRNLVSLLPCVPATYFSLGEFERARADPARWWRLRTARADQAGGRRRLSADEVLQFAEGHSDGIVIQEYIEPVVSGVAYFTTDSVVIESLVGACDPLLRGGAEGDLWTVNIHDADLDSADDQSTDRKISTRWVSSQVVPLSSTAGGQLPDGCLIEWIVDADRQMLVVDLKEVGSRLLSLIQPGNVFWVGHPQEGSASLVLDSPEFIHVDRLTDWRGTYVRCGSGSPLAHFCVEAHEMGISVELTRRQKPRVLTADIDR